MTSPRRGLQYSSHGTSTDDDRPVTPCQRVDPELFFPETAADAATAKRTCRRCEIKETCLKGALERREPAGIWGGERFVAGRIIRVRPGKVDEEAA